VPPRAPVVAVLAALVLLAGCGPEHVDANTYTCGDFQDSFRNKDDTTAGNYIRQLSKKVKKRPGEPDATVQQQVGAAIALACGRKPKDFKPKDRAIQLVNMVNTKKPAETKKTTTEDDTSTEPKTTTTEP
jgi:hypothetical protein